MRDDRDLQAHVLLVLMAVLFVSSIGLAAWLSWSLVHGFLRGI